MEPAFPERHGPVLDNLAGSIILRAGQLASKVRPELRAELADLTRIMHCYYSNLIEGQQTLVPDIEAALHNDFVSDPKKRDLQKLALAHLACQRWAAGYAGSPFAQSFLCELHGRFHSALPPSLCVATTSTGAEVPLTPGILRTGDVQVGNHPAPPHELVPGLLKHFQQRYDDPKRPLATQIISIAASHHRLAWIHPFRDGNGRVARLFSDTIIRQLGIDSGGLWSLSRGLAFARNEYYERLANADQERSSSSADDGRGHLSERALRDFCEFMLKVMLDQISFMDGLLEIETLGDRIERYVSVDAGFGRIGARIYLLVREALYRGEFPRGDAARITGAGERSGRAALAAATGAGLLKSLTPKSPVRLALPSKVLGFYFPRLFPPGALDGLVSSLDLD
jgi:Fic family protein